MPLRAVEGGSIWEHPGPTEAGLLDLAGLRPVGVIAEVAAEDGEMMRLPALLELGRECRPARHEHRTSDPGGVTARIGRTISAARCSSSVLDLGDFHTKAGSAKWTEMKRRREPRICGCSS
ncbi:3,4-dihydroxy-2-butanone-4-phosphate synthase [Sinomonas sp. G460-2]|uniref:3,4-dihydroxy-2-butanone-4-phosphate synthase n=1 Tax=Sinomonas sp. G460-2 TaxID=3393464 RepID=UPI0039EFBC6F